MAPDAVRFAILGVPLSLGSTRRDQVSVAVNGVEGLASALELRHDVLLVDVGLDGYELARRVRAAPGGDKLFLVALTGYGGEEAKAPAVSAGFDLHLTKPVDLNLLSGVLARSLRDARAPGLTHDRRKLRTVCVPSASARAIEEAR